MSKGIAFIIGAIIVTFLALIGILMPFFAIRIHIERSVILETKYTNVELALLTLLSSTNTDTLDKKIKPVYEVISEYISLTDKPDVGFLTPLLNDLIETHNYKLYYIESGQEKILAKQGEPLTYEAKTNVVLPYDENILMKEIHLVID